MIKKRVFVLLVIILILLTACATNSIHCPGNTDMHETTYNISDELNNTKEALLSYFENNKDHFLSIAQEFLQLHNETEGALGVQTHLKQDYITVSMGDKTQILDLSEHKKIDTLLSELKGEPLYINTIYTSSHEVHFDCRTCTFCHTLYIDDEPYFEFTLTYCEEPNAIASFPGFTKQLDTNWFIMGYNME